MPFADPSDKWVSHDDESWLWETVRLCFILKPEEAGASELGCREDGKEVEA